MQTVEIEERREDVMSRARSIAVIVALLCSTHVFAAQDPAAPLWSVKPARWCNTTPAVAPDGTLYFGSFDQKFFALNRDGSTRWSFDTDAEIASSAALAEDGTIYFGCRDRRLYALDVRGGKKWAFETGGWVDSSPAIGHDGTIYFGSWDKRFYALKPNGELLWKFETKGEIESSAAIGADGTIYFGSHDNKFYALDSSGKERWTVTTGGPIISSPALDAEGNIYFTSVDGLLRSVTPTGQLRWHLRTGGITESSPVLASDGTIILGVNRAVWSISSAGVKEWEYPLPEMLRSSASVLADGSFYIVSPWRDVMNIDSDRNVVWSFYSDTPTTGSPVVGPDGTLYCFGRNGSLHAFERRLKLAPGWSSWRADSRNLGSTPKGLIPAESAK